MVTVPMFESKFQKVSNLVMEVGIMLVFFSAFIFQNTSHNKATEVGVVCIIFCSQFIIMMLTLLKGIKDMLLKYQNRKRKVTINNTVITDKTLARSMFDPSNRSEILHTKSPALPTVTEEIDDLETKKMPNEEAKYDSEGLSPMRYVSEFEDMGNEKDLQQKIRQVHDKVFNQTNLEPSGKKTKLGKLLKNMKKKKLRKIKKKETGDGSSKVDDVSEITKDLTSKPSVSQYNAPHTPDKFLTRKSPVEEDKDYNQESPSANETSQFDRSEINDLRTSKISIFSHHQPIDAPEVQSFGNEGRASTKKQVRRLSGSKPLSEAKSSQEDQSVSDAQKSSNGNTNSEGVSNGSPSEDSGRNYQKARTQSD